MSFLIRYVVCIVDRLRDPLHDSEHEKSQVRSDDTSILLVVQRYVLLIELTAVNVHADVITDDSLLENFRASTTDEKELITLETRSDESPTFDSSKLFVSIMSTLTPLSRSDEDVNSSNPRFIKEREFENEKSEVSVQAAHDDIMIESLRNSKESKSATSVFNDKCLH